jgi:hypothetical protein
MKKIDEKIDKKIKIVYSDLEGNIATESIWAQKEKEYYRIKNIPFFAPNISYNDLISVEKDNDELFFDELIETSGHTTLQMVIYNEDDIIEITNDLIQLNCDWEGSHIKTYISVDVPKETNYRKVKDYLDNKRSINKLDYKESCLAHHL